MKKYIGLDVHKEATSIAVLDARKLAELLRAGLLRAVYHGENGLRTLRELARSYLTISKDQARVMSRLKALYRSWGIPCSGTLTISLVQKIGQASNAWVES
ncbi:MAG: hypothetical protein WBE76_11280 [Terracidiphilus sp.]